MAKPKFIINKLPELSSLPPLPVTNQTPVNVPQNTSSPVVPANDTPVGPELKPKLTEYPSTLEEFQEGLKEHKNWGDPVLAKMPEGKAEMLINSQFNDGSKVISELRKKLATEQANEVAPNPNAEAVTPATQSSENKKDVFNQLVQQNIEKLMGENLKDPTPTRPSDVVNSFSGGIGKGLKSLTDYLGTSQGQNVMSGLFSAFGNQDAQLGYARNANRVREQELLNQKNYREDQENKLKDLISIYKSNNSLNKGGVSFKDAVDIAYNTKDNKGNRLISDEGYTALQSLDSYINDDYMPASTTNKLLEPYLIGKRQVGASELEDKKQTGRKELQGIRTEDDLKKLGQGHTYKLEEIGAEAGARTAGQKEVAGYKESLPSTQADTENKKAATLKIIADISNKGKEKYSKSIADNESTLKNIDDGIKAIENDPTAYSYIYGQLPANITNRIDPKGVKTRAIIDDVTAVYRKWLTGAQMSDKERKDYERFLPAPSDNAKIIKDKLNSMRNLIQNQTNIYKGAMSAYTEMSSGGQSNKPKIGQRAKSKSGKPIILTEKGWVYEQ